MAREEYLSDHICTSTRLTAGWEEHSVQLTKTELLGSCIDGVSAQDIESPQKESVYSADSTLPMVIIYIAKMSPRDLERTL